MEYAPRRKLTREFKLEAVRQVALSEKPKAQLARELGVRVGQLRTWRLLRRSACAQDAAIDAKRATTIAESASTGVPARRTSCRIEIAPQPCRSPCRRPERR